MKKILPLLLIISLTSLNLKAQKFETAGEYMDYIGKAHKEVSEQMLSYISASAHKRQKKSDKERKELIQTIKDARKKVANMPAFDGDKTYRDAVSDYLKLNLIVLNEDYEKIMDMEAIAEQSYDLMEAYLTAQQEANKKVNSAMDDLRKKQKEFASKYNIEIVSNKNDVSKKLDIANEVIAYYNKIYLIFFKSYKQELYVLEAVNANDVSSIEQNKNALEEYAEEGLAELNKIPSFKGDGKLKYACKSALNFYKQEAEKDFATTVDFYLKKKHLEDTKTALDALKKSERTQENIDQYNDAVNAYNKAAKAHNAVINAGGAKRTAIINGWNKASNDFLDKHIPKK